MTDKPTEPEPDYGDDYDEDYWDEDDNDWDQCGMMNDGQCSMAGSEWCDWDCRRNRPVRLPKTPVVAPPQQELDLDLTPSRRA